MQENAHKPQRAALCLTLVRRSMPLFTLFLLFLFLLLLLLLLSSSSLDYICIPTVYKVLTKELALYSQTWL